MKRRRLLGGLVGLCAAAALVGAFVISGCGSKQPAGVADVLDLAPADTTLVLVVDFKKLTESGVIDKLDAVKKARQSGELPIDPKSLNQFAVFVVADPDKPDKSKVTGVMTHSAPPKDILDQLKKNSLGASVKVGKLDAYKTKADALAAVADDKTVLFGNDQESLARVIALYDKRTAGPAAVKAAVGNYQKSHVRFALLLSDKLKAKAIKDAGPNAPKYLADINQAAGGLDITADKVYLDGAVTFGKSATAKQAADEANAKLVELAKMLAAQIEQAKKARGGAAMVPAMQSALNLLKSVKVSAEAADMRVTMGMAVTDLQDIVRMVPMMVMGAMMSAQPPTGGPPPARR